MSVRRRCFGLGKVAVGRTCRRVVDAFGIVGVFHISFHCVLIVLLVVYVSERIILIIDEFKDMGDLRVGKSFEFGRSFWFHE